MASFNKFDAFVESLAEKKFDLGADQINLALTNTAPIAANSVLADLAEITYTGLSARNVTTTSSAQTGGTYRLVLADLVLTASGGSVGPFRYVALYDDTAIAKDLIGWYDYGSSITLAAGETLTVDFDGTNGVLTIA